MNHCRSFVAIFQVHRWLLQLSSGYFAALFRSSESVESKEGKVTLKETTEKALEAVVDFIYTNKVPPSVINLQDLIELFKLADRFVRS